MAGDDLGGNDVDAIHESGGDGSGQYASGANDQGHPSKDAQDTPDQVKAYVNSWLDRVKGSKRHFDKVWERMDQCMLIATVGAAKDWTDNPKNYVVPILNRIINVDVAQLYARNPKALSKRKERMMYTVWDGNINSLREAEASVQQAQQAAQAHAMMASQPQAQPLPGAPPAPPPPPPPPPDPQALAVIQDAETVKTYNSMVDGVAKTLTILHNHYMEDPAEQYKQLFKALVRRVKTVGVGYVRLNFQRMLQKQPDITAKIDETTERIATMERLTEQLKDDELQEGSAGLEEMRTTLAALQDQEQVVVKEGPFWTFPRPKNVILDPATRHLKTLYGCGWTAEEMDLTPGEIMENYGVDVGSQFTEYSVKKGEWDRWSETDRKLQKTATARVYRIMSKKTGTEFVLADGYPGYIQPPAPPKVKIPRFFDIFPLVFNEIEDDKELYPPSDVWLARHMQFEYNRTREFLREHRQQNRPAYLTSAGSFEEKDLQKLQSHESGEIIQLAGIGPSEKVADKLQAKPVMSIDPKQYEVESIYSDIQRVTGSQQADMGAVSGSTATESSISEESRQTDIGDARDDLDEFLSLLAQSTGYLMLRELTPPTVQAIVGPGAQWPQIPETREELADEILLSTRAGGSGRPNQQADLAKLERAMPFLLQLPGVNPVPIVQRYADTLELDLEEMVLEGLPSIITMNQMMQQPPAPPPGAAPPGAGAAHGPAAPHPAQMAPGAPGAPPGAHNAPGAQGPAGANNAPTAPGTRPGPQPGFPAPAIHAPGAPVVHFDPQGNPIRPAA